MSDPNSVDEQNQGEQDEQDQEEQDQEEQDQEDEWQTQTKAKKTPKKKLSVETTFLWSCPEQVEHTAVQQTAKIFDQDTHLIITLIPCSRTCHEQWTCSECAPKHKKIYKCKQCKSKKLCARCDIDYEYSVKTLKMILNNIAICRKCSNILRSVE